jgi:hypothetical protein
MVVRLHPMTDFKNLLLNIVQFAGGQSCWRQHGLALILCDADENVASAQIVKIIGEGAHRVEDDLRIPALLELQSLPFHSLTVQDIINLDWQMHRRRSIGHNRLRENQIVPRRRIAPYAPFRFQSNSPTKNLHPTYNPV